MHVNTKATLNHQNRLFSNEDLWQYFGGDKPKELHESMPLVMHKIYRVLSNFDYLAHFYLTYRQFSQEQREFYT